MGLLFLGGVLAAATACVAYRWMDRKTARLVALVLLITPVVFWEISAAGAPDLWMSFYTTIGVLVISRYREMPRMPLAIAAGALAGGVAGAKYTGCLGAASLAAAFLWEARSAARTVLFELSALAVGVWPYARNLMWTGDPVFPFLLRYISPERVNAYTLASYLADTGASEHKEFWQLAAFPLFAAIDPAHLGFWQFSGAAGAGVRATADLDGTEHTVAAGRAGNVGWKRDAHWVQDGHDAISVAGVCR